MGWKLSSGQTHFAMYTLYTYQVDKFKFLIPIGNWDEISKESTRLYADSMPSLLGITSLSKGKGGPAQIYDGKFVSINLAADYFGNAKDLQKAIERHSVDWDGNSPLFIAVQAIAWRLYPTDILGIVDCLDSRFEVVRTDTFFQLALEDHNK